MPKIILQPCGSNDSKNHYRDTIVTRISINQVLQYLNQSDIDILNQIYPTSDFMIWGVTRGNQDRNFDQWNKIETGDIALFAAKNVIFSCATVTHKIQNRGLATSLWGNNNLGDTWECIYFLEEYRDLEIQVSDFNAVLNYAPNYIIRGFRVLSQDDSNKFFLAYDLMSPTFGARLNNSDYINLVQLLSNINVTDRLAKVYQRTEQVHLKKLLFGFRTLSNCACCNRELPISFLVTAHIKQRSKCTIAERTDPNVVFPLCNLGCDDLFERGYLRVRNGYFEANIKNPNTQQLNQLINQYNGRICTFYNTNNQIYFEWHYNFHA
jgi:hypothetical protein